MMRPRFYELLREALETDERVVAVTAEIGTAPVGPHPRHVNVGIREQLLIGVAAGLALEGKRPVTHSYAPFLVERPYEQLKLDLGHNDLGAVLVSTGASYDAAHEGRTHQAPEDVAALAALPGWTIHVPGHADELEQLFRDALAGDDRVYIRMSEEENHARVDGGGFAVLRRGSAACPARPRRRPEPRAGARGDGRPRRDARLRRDRAPVPASRAPGGARGRVTRSSSSSRISPARRPPRSPRRCSTARTGCSRSASRTRSSAATAPAPSIAPRTGSTPPGSAGSLEAFLG